MKLENKLMDVDQARAAFERDAAKLYARVPVMDTKAVSDPKLSVPGFVTFETFIGQRSTRGWARDDGTTVLARRVNFGPLLEALGFRDDGRSPSARAIAERLAWMHGPLYTLVDKVSEGECGAPQTLYVEPERDRWDDGRVEFRFALKMDEAYETESPVVIQYRVFGNPDGRYEIDIYQIAPQPVEPDNLADEHTAPQFQEQAVEAPAQIEYRIRWFSIFRFPDPADEDRWYKGPQGIAAVIDLLASTSLWPELQVFGTGFEYGEPLVKDLAALKQRIASKPDIYIFARGGARAAAHTEEAQVAVEIDLSPSQVELKFQAGDVALERLGRQFLDDVTNIFVQLLQLWRGKTNLVWCAAVPVGQPTFVYPRPRPPRKAVYHRSLNAIVDIVMNGPAPAGSYPFAVAESQAIAAATPPAGVVRSAHPNAVVLRWVDDPRNRNAVALAAGRHEAWMTGLVNTELLSGWNEHGDRQLIVSDGISQRPFWVVDRSKGIGYFEIAAQPDGTVAADDWAQVEALADALPEGVRELALVAPARDAALALAARARSLGINKVLYALDKSVWDPDPSGPWLP
jgi:hypothetical protein